MRGEHLEAHRGADALEPAGLGQGGPPHRDLDAPEKAAGEGGRGQMPQAQMTGERDGEKEATDQHRRGIRSKQEAPAVESLGQGTGHGTEQEERQETGEAHQGHGHGRAGLAQGIEPEGQHLEPAHDAAADAGEPEPAHGAVAQHAEHGGTTEPRLAYRGFDGR